jgi:peptidoglycan/LPS O-acetylase OafA/YrhL
MPAAFVGLAGIMVFGATVATRQQAEALPGDVLAASTWTANWRFVLNGQSYLNLFGAPSPVQHYWSLSIEEQFYLVLPIVVLALMRWRRSTTLLAGVLGAVAVASSAWMFVLYHNGASLDRLYYGTDTRMAELLAGSVLALVLARRGTDFSPRARVAIGAASVAAFAVTAWGWVALPLDDNFMWRGGFLGFSLLSCVLVVAVVTDTGPVAALYKWSPLAATGRICYGLYVYHWPIFLWLTEDRTGLSRWPLFALRAGVTFTAAIASYRWLERPVLRGASFGFRGNLRYALAPLTAVLVVAGTFVTVDRSGVDPLGTLRAEAASQSMPREATDGTLDLLVVPRRADDPVITRLVADARGRHDVRLTVAPPYSCTGGVVTTGDGKTCASFARSWPELIRRHNPDVVLFYADGWAGTPLTTLGGPSPDAQTNAAVSLLGPAFDLLTARGAPVVWAAPGTSELDAYRRSVQPFYQAMARLKAQRNDVKEVIGGRLPDPTKVDPDRYAERSASVLLDDSSLYQREAGHSLPRVLVVGDSQALSLGYGLDRWSAEQKRALVWNHGIEGCGVVVGGETRSFGASNSGMERCRAAARAWPANLKSFRPDVVIVLSSVTDVQDRRLPGATKFSSIGDPDFDAFLVAQYEQVVDTLSSTGARVVWMTPPCTALRASAGQPAPYDTSNIQHLDDTIVAKVARDRPKLVRFDLASILCPGGEPLESVAGVGELRPDGVHFSVEAALWFARTYGEKVLAAGGV